MGGSTVFHVGFPGKQSPRPSWPARESGTESSRLRPSRGKEAGPGAFNRRCLSSGPGDLGLVHHCCPSCWKAKAPGPSSSAQMGHLMQVAQGRNFEFCWGASQWGRQILDRRSAMHGQLPVPPAAGGWEPASWRGNHSIPCWSDVSWDAVSSLMDANIGVSYGCVTNHSKMHCPKTKDNISIWLMVL